jgi:hypothetical protein
MSTVLATRKVAWTSPDRKSTTLTASLLSFRVPTAMKLPQAEKATAVCGSFGLWITNVSWVVKDHIVM